MPGTIPSAPRASKKATAHCWKVLPPTSWFADIRLGDFNGLQLVAVRPPSTAAVVMSGHWDNTLEAEARKHGAAYLPKPMSANLLVGTLKQVLAGRAAGDSSA